MAIDPPNPEAVELAHKLNDALILLTKACIFDVPVADTDDELLALPLDKVKLDESLELLPSRLSLRRRLAVEIAILLHPDEKMVTAINSYERNRTKVARWVRHSRRYDIVIKAREQKRKQERCDWRSAIKAQGLWDPDLLPISLNGPPNLPMRIEIASEKSLQPFFTHLGNNGTNDPRTTLGSGLDCQQIIEPCYGTPALQFPKGVIYEDCRLDLCKMGVGPTHMGALMENLRKNMFVEHFLLGNNIIGPQGARTIAKYLWDWPNRITTWYLTGNDISGAAFTELVDAMSLSVAVRSVWLRRNPLGALKGSNYVMDLCKLITGTRNLRTLDLSQTEMGDGGVEYLFTRLNAYRGRSIQLENLYLSGNGIGVKGAVAIAKFLKSTKCSLKSLYMSNNPLGTEGMLEVAKGVMLNETLEVLCLQSVGMGDLGANYIFQALEQVPCLRVLDIGTSYATKDLEQAYNTLTEASSAYIRHITRYRRNLEYLNLGATFMPTAVMSRLLRSASKSPSLLYFNVVSAYHHIKHRQTDLEHSRDKQMLRASLTANVQNKHGPHMTYEQWLAEEKRWLISDKTDVRKIDSVYQTRERRLTQKIPMELDMWCAEEGEDELVESEDMLVEATGPGGPVGGA